MNYLIEILIVVLLIVVFIVLFVMNHRTKRPEGNYQIPEKCSNCPNTCFSSETVKNQDEILKVIENCDKEKSDNE